MDCGEDDEHQKLEEGEVRDDLTEMAKRVIDLVKAAVKEHGRVRRALPPEGGRSRNEEEGEVKIEDLEDLISPHEELRDGAEAVARKQEAGEPVASGRRP